MRIPRRRPSTCVPLPWIARARASIFGLSLTASGLHALEIPMNDPFIGTKVAGISQPRADFIVTDPRNGDAPIQFVDPWTELPGPAVFSAFLDTGASGFAISALHNATDPDIREATPQLDLGAADLQGVFTETGIGGTELGDVTQPFGIAVLNGRAGDGLGLPASSFTPYGEFSFWVRQDIGTGEYNEFFGLDPINLVGMPVLRQRRMWMTPPVFDPFTLFGENMATTLLTEGATEPATNLTLPMRLQNFLPIVPPGEVAPSFSENPLVRSVKVSHTGGTPHVGDWLFDTGAQSTILSFAVARQVGLIPSTYTTLEAFMADYTGPTTEVGGIGASRTVPLLTADSISVPTAEGAIAVWNNVTVIVVDVAGLPGIFGMNLLVPSVTPDPLDPLGSLFDIAPAVAGDTVFEVTDDVNAELRIAVPGLVWDYTTWRSARFATADASNAAVSGTKADPDGDGCTNFAEFAFGSDPLRADPEARATSLTTPKGTEAYWTFEYSAASSVAGVTERVEVSTDLVTWVHGSDVAEPIATRRQLGQRLERVRVLVSPVGGRLFVRVVAVPQS